MMVAVNLSVNKKHNKERIKPFVSANKNVVVISIIIYYSGLGAGDKSMQGLRGLLILLDRLSERPEVDKILVGTTNDPSAS
jgi:hypothetical protein